MTTRWERFLASLDRVTGWDMNGSNEHGGANYYYHTRLGPKMAIVSRDDQCLFLGQAGCVIHVYDQDGKLLSRKSRRKMLAPGDRVFYGRRRAYQAYDQYAIKVPLNGGLVID